MPALIGIDIGAMREGIKAWALAASGLTDQQVIYSFQSGVQPAKPFISFLVTGPFREGVIDAFAPGTGDQGAVSGPRRFDVSVHVFGDPGNDQSVEQIAESLSASFEVPALRAILTECNVSPDKTGQVGMGIANVGDPADLSTELATKYQRHIHFDFSLNVTSNVFITDPQDTLDPAAVAQDLSGSLS